MKKKLGVGLIGGGLVSFSLVDSIDSGARTSHGMGNTTEALASSAVLPKAENLG